MDVPTLIREALATLRVNQAELACRLERGEGSLSRWLSGLAKPDYESCLRLAKITSMSPRVVLEIVGLDPTLLPVADVEALTPIQRDVLTRAGRIQAAVDAADGVPDEFVEVYLRKVLDNTEGEITAALDLVHRQRQTAPPPTSRSVPPSNRRRRVTKAPAQLGKPNDEEKNQVVVRKNYPSWKYRPKSVAHQIAEYGFAPAI